MQPQRLLPQDIEAEEAVLGSLLIDEQSLAKVAYFLKPEDFAREKHRWCYQACLDLFNRGEPMDQRTVSSELSRHERLDLVGGDAFLSHLVQVVPTSVHVEYYGRLVCRAAMLGRLVEAAHEIETLAYEAPGEVDQALRTAEDILYRLRMGEGQRDFVPLKDVFERYYKEARPGDLRGAEQLTSVPTGFVDIDKLLGGFQRSDMVVLAARPSLGKSSLALTIARGSALTHGAKVALFSMEMGREQVADRFISMHAGIDTHRLRTGNLNEAEQERVDQAIGELSDLRIWIDDSPLLRPVEMRSKARRLYLEMGLDLLIVDYIQLMGGSNSRSDNRVQEMSEISRSIKELARNLNVPVLAISQLSRAPEMRTPHVPQLADLRDSGSIEQDADVVMFIYRDDAYYDEEQWSRLHPTERYPKNIAQIRVAKHRHGPLGTAKLRFNPQLATFQDLGWRED